MPSMQLHMDPYVNPDTSILEHPAESPLHQNMRMLDQGKHFHYMLMPMKRNRHTLLKASSYLWS